jgi:hypothetical protein
VGGERGSAMNCSETLVEDGDGNGMEEAPQIKEEMDEDDMEEEDEEEDEDEEDGLIKPSLENILSTSEESSEESVSEFDEEDPIPQPPLNGSSPSSCAPLYNPHLTHFQGGINNSGTRAALLQGFSNSGKFGEGEPRKKREAFTLQQKLQVLKFLESHSVNATSRFYKVDPKSIRLWRSQKVKIEQTVQGNLHLIPLLALKSSLNI